MHYTPHNKSSIFFIYFRYLTHHSTMERLKLKNEDQIRAQILSAQIITDNPDIQYIIRLNTILLHTDHE